MREKLLNGRKIDKIGEDRKDRRRKKGKKWGFVTVHLVYAPLLHSGGT